MMAGRERVNRADPFPRDVYGRRVGEFDQPRSRMYDSRVQRRAPPPESVLGYSKDRFGPEQIHRPNPTQSKPISPTAPSLDRNVPLMGRELPPAPRSPRGQIPEGDQFFGDEYGAGASMGGPVKRRKKKAKGHGGKIKRYAKGGGIRRAKY